MTNVDLVTILSAAIITFVTVSIYALLVAEWGLRP